MSRQLISAELRQWLLDQAGAGQTPEAMLQSMVASGWVEDVALEAMQEVLQTGVNVRQVSLVVTPVPDLRAKAASEVWAHDRVVKVLVQMQHPRIVVIADLLTAEECEALMAMAKPRLRRSETVVDASGGSEVNEARTSQGMFFARGENELCARIEARIAALVDWPVENGEGLQILRYAVGAEYKPHYDYFDPAQPGTAVVLRRGGQRVGTVVMYLNTPEEGGATVFPDIGLHVHAVAGSAVFFAYGDAAPSSKTLHGGDPVTKGEKWVATKWMRQSRFD